MQAVTIVDVVARDGIQNEKQLLTTDQKIELLHRIRDAGIHDYEVTSFVHPRLVPQLADAEHVFAAVQSYHNDRKIALVVNGRGYTRAKAAGAKEVRMVVAASETMNLKNANATIEQTLAQYRPVLEAAKSDGIKVTVVIAVAFGCPYEGAVDPHRVLAISDEFVSMGVVEVDFADTVGMAVPTQVAALIRTASQRWHTMRIGAHFHNTRNVGIANAYAAIEAGVDILDASLGGAGGCPFAPRATGNIPTEDLVFMLEGMGYNTGLDLDRLIVAAQWLEKMLGRTLPGMVMKAGSCWTTPAPVLAH
jgi:isopropylmalate/homocitrate/citramalate synthase